MNANHRRLPSKSSDARTQFLQQVLAIARALPPLKVGGALPDAYGFALNPGSEDECHVYLDNLFAETRELPPEDRPDAIRNFLQVAAAGRPPDLDWDEARPRLRVAIRSALQVGPPSPDPTLAPFCREVLPGLREHVVIDHGRTMAFARRVDAMRWERSDDAVYRTAYANMEPDRSANVELFERRPSPIWHIDSAVGYESSRLLLPGFLASFADRVEGRPIAIVPHRSALLIAGDRKPRTVLRLCELALREYGASTRPVSFALYTVDDAGAVVPYVRQVEDEAAYQVRVAQLQFMRVEYDRQQEMLDEHHSENGSRVFVATFMALRLKRLGPASLCVWDQDLHGLLPKTDYIGFDFGGTSDDDLSMVRWDDVARIVGDLLTPEPGLFPQRWRTPKGRIPGEKLEQLRAVQIAVRPLVGP